MYACSMKKLIIFIAFVSAVIIFTHKKEYSNEQIVNAIFIAEGENKATYLYGIRSVHYEDAKEAREICFRTVSHARTRWEKKGRPGDLLQFIQKSYCPGGTRNDLCENWLKNVRSICKRNM